MHNNRLEVLPPEVADLKKLKTLSISNNDLGTLDPRLSLRTSLVRINIEGNPLKSIKTQIRSAGAEPLKAYLKTRLTENEIQKDEIAQGIALNLPGLS